MSSWRTNQGSLYCVTRILPWMQKVELQSRIVFLDTNVYIAKNYQFLTHSLGSVKALCDKDEIRLIVTDITSEEVKSHIRSAAAETAAVMKRVKKDAMLIRNLPDVPAFGIFTSLTAGDIEAKLLADWAEFLGSEGVEMLTVDAVMPSRVFSRYFSVSAPFAQGAKEKEFADAFVLERLSDFSKARTHSVHVISNDKDLERFCEADPGLIYSDSLDDFIGAVNLSVSVEPAAFAAEALASVQDRILEFVQERVREIDFEIQSSDWDADLEDVDVRDLEFVKANLVSVDDEQCVYEMEFKSVIDTIESIKDYGRSPFDHEDNSYPFVLETQVERTFEAVISVEATIYYQDKLVNSVDFDLDMPYGVTLTNPVEEHRRELDINGE